MNISNKKYRFVKELPQFAVGDIIETNEAGNHHHTTKNGFVANDIALMLHTGIIEEVGAWRPNKGDGCYVIYSDGSIGSFVWNGANRSDDKHLDFGSIFPTREAAEAARDKVRDLLKSLRQ